MIEFDDDEARLLYAVVFEKAREHLMLANPSEVANSHARGRPESRVHPDILRRSTTAALNLGVRNPQQRRMAWQNCCQPTLIAQGREISKRTTLQNKMRRLGITKRDYQPHR